LRKKKKKNLAANEFCNKEGRVALTLTGIKKKQNAYQRDTAGSPGKRASETA